MFSVVRIVVPFDDGRLTTQEASPALTGEERARSLSAPRSPVQMTAGLLRGRWTVPILWQLYWGGKSFHQLLRELDGCGSPALANALEKMQKNGLVERRFLSSGPRVVHALTPLGESLKPVVGVMYEWGLKAQLWSGEPGCPEAARAPQGEH